MPAKRAPRGYGSALSDVAKRAGVSLATASRVLAGSTHRVSGALRERVLSAAQSLDYVPNASARSLIRGMRKVVGVLLHDAIDSLSCDYIRTFEEVADRQGWLIMLVSVTRNIDKEIRYLRMFREERVGAIILVGSGLEDPAYKATLSRELGGYAKHGGRIATTGRHGLPFTEFMPDNAGGAQAACEHLLGFGHTRIGILTGPRTIAGTHDRLTGAKRAFAAAGAHWNEDLVASEGDFSRSCGALACEHLLGRVPQLTAIFAMSDDMAIGVYDTARNRGLRIPVDLSVIGYGDSAIAHDVSPALTTVTYPAAELARRAIEACVGDATLEPAEVLVPCELIVRKSVAAPRTR
jgi:LacI family transcriptional regulator